MSFWDEPADDDKVSYDPLYVLNRDSEFRQDVRDFVDSLWARYAPYCGDANFLAERNLSTSLRHRHALV